LARSPGIGIYLVARPDRQHQCPDVRPSRRPKFRLAISGASPDHCASLLPWLALRKRYERSFIILRTENPPPGPQIRPDAAQATAELRADHKHETSLSQRAVDRLTAVLGMPGFAAVLTISIILWMSANVVARFLGLWAIDPPPFVWLQGAITTGALYVAILILTTQRREDQLSSQRGQLMLELAILNDQKSSKIIELLDKSRRDDPMIADRIDNEARAMSTPSDHRAVMDAIKEPQSSNMA
jgi:uncharacterized membrane protein